MAFTTTLFGQESFRQYYGQPYAFANEEGFSIEKMGERFVLIGTRENQENISEDIAFWFFDPESLTLTDSMIIALPEDQRLLDTYAGPDGGVLIIFERTAFPNDNDFGFAYYGPDGGLAWEQTLTNEVPNIDFEGIRDVTFKSSTELVLTLMTFGSGAELAPRVVNFTATDGFTNSFFYGDPGADAIWSIEHQPGGDILIAGEGLNDVFVALLAEDGTVKWENRFEDVEGSFGSRRYDFLSDVHRPANDTVILVTGSVGFFGRAFIVMDTFGTRLAEYELEDFSLELEGKEQATWVGDSLLFVNDNTNEFFGLFSLISYEPSGEFSQGVGSSQGYSTRGSLYDVASQRVFTASRKINEDNDAAIVRFAPNTFMVDIKDIGTRGRSSREEAYALATLPDDGFLLLTQGITPPEASDGLTNFFYVDNQGQPQDTLMINDDFFQRGPVGVGRTGEDLLLLFTRPDRWLVYRYTTAGEQVWEAAIQGASTFSLPAVIGLPGGRFAGRSVLQTQLQVPPFSIIQTTSMYVADSTGTVSDTVSTNRLNFGTVIAGSQDDLIFAGNSYTSDTAIIISKDITTDLANWEYTTTFGGDTLTNIQSILQLADGSYAAVLATSITQEGETNTSLFYLHLSAAGEELLRQELTSGHPSFQFPVLAQGANDEITLVYGVELAPEDTSGEETFELRANRLNPATGEELLVTAFQSPFSRTNPVAVELLADGSTAILATATASDTSASPDVLLLVFDAEGMVTNLSAPQPLGIKLTISPNPTPDLVNVAFHTDVAGKIDLQLIDVTGRPLTQRTLTVRAGDRQTIDLQTYPAGTYFLMLRNQAGQMEVRRVVKQ